MSRLSLLFALTLGFTSLSPSIAEAQAWTRDQGGVYAGLSYRWISASAYYDRNGDRVEGPRFTQHTLGLYGEVGAIDRWLMFTLEGELFRQNEFADLATVRGVGDWKIGAWTGLLEAPFRLSLGVTLGLPFGRSNPSADADASQEERDATAMLPTGGGEWDVSFRLAAGYSHQWDDIFSLYTIAEFGYVLRTSGFVDQIAYRAELGFKVPREIIDRFLLIFRVTGLESLETPARDIGPTGIGDGVSGTFWGVELAARLHDELYLGVGFESAFRAENLPAAPALKVSIAYQYLPGS